MKFHTLAGLPRSGTTLLANVLSQHPDVFVSGTSALPLCVESFSNTLSSAPEVQSDLVAIPGAYERYLRALRGMIEGWYADRKEKFIFDKGRGWVMHRALLDQLYPDATLVVSVRDPRDVIASIERQHRKTALFTSPMAPTLYESADLLMKPDGMVGGPIRFIEDLLRRQVANVCWVRYESFVVDPKESMKRIENAAGLKPFHWDFEHVSNSSTDVDGLYRHKFPHDGDGPIKPKGISWEDCLSPELAATIAAVYPLYMHTFGYA